MTCHNQLSAKAPEANIQVTFDYSTVLQAGEVLVATPTVSIEVIGGTDPDPSVMLVGTPVIDTGGSFVQQQVQGGLDGCYYQLKCICDTTVPGRRLVITAVLPVHSSV